MIICLFGVSLGGLIHAQVSYVAHGSQSSLPAASNNGPCHHTSVLRVCPQKSSTPKLKAQKGDPRTL